MFIRTAEPRSLIERLEGIAAEHGDSPAQSFVASGDPADDPIQQTFGQFVADVRRRSNALAALGVGADDIVAFAAPLSDSSYPMLVATLIAATLAPINYFLEVEALIRIVKASGASVLLIHRRFDDGADIVDRLRKVHRALPHLRLLVFGIGPDVDEASDIDGVATDQSSTSWPESARERTRERVVALFHTGGTTGLPKLVPHTEAMYDAMLESCGAGEATAPGETILSGLPLFHTSGILQAGIVPLFNGTHIVIPSSRGFRDRRAISNYWRFVQRYRVTVGAGVPTVLAALTAVAPDGPVTSLKRILVGGAPLARATIARIVEITGGAEVIEGWGMTETCGFSVMNPYGRTKVGSVGLPFPGVELQIRRFAAGDRSGTVCGVDEVGEVVVRGDIVIQRYFDERPNSFCTDDWLRTGDLGRLDPDGYLWITGRLKDIIIRGGHNIDPALIEEPAYQHPAVQLAAAVGRPDKRVGELPVLYVQLKPEATATADELDGFVRERIQERAAMPKAILIVPEIPLSGPGKISKLQLRRQAIADAYQEELNRSSLSEIEIRATTVEDDKSGEIVLLTYVDGKRPDTSTRQRLEAALEGFTIPFRWADDAVAPVDRVELAP